MNSDLCNKCEFRENTQNKEDLIGYLYDTLNDSTRVLSIANVIVKVFRNNIAEETQQQTAKVEILL